MNAPTDDDRIRQHADLVYRTCLRITGNAQDAADVAQEVFVAWLRQHREIRGSVAAWLYGTARQRSLDWLRANHRRDRHEQQAALPAIAGAPDEDWRTHLDDALNELPTSARTLVVEHHLLGLTQGQLAARYRCTQATISRRLTQTLDLLRASLRSRGVTVSGAALLAGFTAAPATACPAPLVAPVLAQAQVVGTSALVGSTVMGGLGLFGWKAIAAGLLVFCTMMGGIGAWWWGTTMARDLDRDWTAVATAHLPPVPPTTQRVTAPAQSPRYPSIEALIARQRPLDAARQARLEALIAPGGQAPWSFINDWSITALSSIATKLRAGAVLKTDEAKMVERWQTWVRPMLAELHQGELALGSGAALERAYADGRLGSLNQRSAWLRSRSGTPEHAVGYLFTSLLIHAATQASDPEQALADLDAWVAAYSRGVITIYEALLVQALCEHRDRFYQELAWRGRLPLAAQQRWLAEKSSATAQMSEAFLGETLLLNIPHVEDLRAGRATNGGLFAHLGDLSYAQELTWLPQQLETIQEALAGQFAARFQALVAQEKSGLWANFWPTIMAETNLAALAETRHRARRLAVEILMSARAGEPLPETIPSVAGSESSSRGTTAWGLRYERMSATRFALMVDPDTGLPACSAPEQAASLRSELREARARPKTKPLVDNRLVIEIEMEVPVPPPATPIDLSDPVPTTSGEDLPPPFPSVAQ